MMTPDEMIAVLEAFKEGKAIQGVSGDRWFDIQGTPIWNFRNYSYRVKPAEPRELWVSVSRQEIRTFEPEPGDDEDDGSFALFREVLED